MAGKVAYVTVALLRYKFEFLIRSNSFIFIILLELEESHECRHTDLVGLLGARVVLTKCLVSSQARKYHITGVLKPVIEELGVEDRRTFS